MSLNSVFVCISLAQIFSLASCGMLKGSNFLYDSSQPDTIHPHQINSGLLKLIVKTYIEELLSDSDIEDENVKQKLIDLG